MSTDDAIEDLREATSAFAQDLTATCRNVLGSAAPEFGVHMSSGRGREPRAWVSAFKPGKVPEADPIAISIGGRILMTLTVTYYITWDSLGMFLRVDKSEFEIRASGRGEALWRYDYLYSTDWKPTSYLHVHAHRDEITHLVLVGRKKRAQTLLDGPPLHGALSRLHFPLGGDRFRPCLEDTLEMLVREFDIDRESTWEAAIKSGRMRWREMQLGAAVRDNPEKAASTLRNLGYTVTHDDPPSARPSRVHY